MNQLTVMCTTRGERRFISIRCQMECVESKLDSHSDYSAHLQVLKNLDTKVSKGAKIRNRYNQVPHLTQNTSLKNSVILDNFDSIVSIYTMWFKSYEQLYQLTSDGRAIKPNRPCGPRVMNIIAK